MLNVNEIFRSLDGEVNPQSQGCLTTFVRLQGCNLLPFCSYCDTVHAQDKHKMMYAKSVEDILNIIPKGKVTITGGEPLLQKETKKLIIGLLDEGHKVSVETNGSIIIPEIHHPGLSWIIDYKLSHQNEMRIFNFWKATLQDWIKFVITNPDDFQIATNVSKILVNGGCKARIAFSPADTKKDIIKWGMANPAQWIAEKIIEKQLWHITLNLQIHKLIWPDGSEGVSLL